MSLASVVFMLVMIDPAYRNSTSHTLPMPNMATCEAARKSVERKVADALNAATPTKPGFVLAVCVEAPVVSQNRS